MCQINDAKMSECSGTSPVVPPPTSPLEAIRLALRSRRGVECVHAHMDGRDLLVACLPLGGSILIETDNTNGQNKELGSKQAELASVLAGAGIRAIKCRSADVAIRAVDRHRAHALTLIEVVASAKDYLGCALAYEKKGMSEKDAAVFGMQFCQAEDRLRAAADHAGSYPRLGDYLSIHLGGG